jgi:RimJ/RimL family protein N-acetyltransferase
VVHLLSIRKARMDEPAAVETDPSDLDAGAARLAAAGSWAPYGQARRRNAGVVMREAIRSARLREIKLLVDGRLRLGLRSRFTRYGLRRDLAVPITTPSAKIPISVRPLEPSDLSVLLPEYSHVLDPHEQVQIAWRRDFYKKAPEGCWVAIDKRSGTPCYMQWLFGSSENPLIRTLGGFPDLEPDEALLENAFTPVAYRGLGIMSAAMALIAERAASIGARNVLTFVGDDNIGSLKGCQRAGFHPHLLNKRVRLLYGMINSDKFERLAADDPRRTMQF